MPRTPESLHANLCERCLCLCMILLTAYLLLKRFPISLYKLPKLTQMKIWRKLCLLSFINYKTHWGTKTAFLLSQIFIALSPILALWERQQDIRHGFGASLVAQLEKEMATHSSILAWKISWIEEPGGLQSIGSQRVRHDWATNTN